MIDKDKVLRGLECCGSIQKCEECPYSIRTKQGVMSRLCYESKLHEDAAALIKEMEENDDLTQS